MAHNDVNVGLLFHRKTWLNFCQLLKRFAVGLIKQAPFSPTLNERISAENIPVYKNIILYISRRIAIEFTCFLFRPLSSLRHAPVN